MLNFVMGPTHELMGATSGVMIGTSLGLSLPQTAVLTGAMALSSSLPDIFELTVFEHRTITHSLLMIGCLIGTLAVVGGMVFNLLQDTFMRPAVVPAFAGVAWGYVLHVLADMCTRRGVPLLYPLSPRPCWLVPAGLRVRTDAASESVFAVVWLVCSAGFVAVNLGLVP